MKFVHSAKNLDEFLLNFLDLSGAKEIKERQSCRSGKILQRASFLAPVAGNTAGTEPLQI